MPAQLVTRVKANRRVLRKEEASAYDHTRPPQTRPVKLHFHYTPAPGYTELVARGAAPTELLDFGMLRLDEGQTFAAESGGDEVGLVILSGTCDVRAGGERIERLGERADVFAGRGSGVYVPRGMRFEVRGGPGGG